MVDSKLLAILRCPLSGQALRMRPITDNAAPPRWRALGETFGIGAPAFALETVDGTWRYPLWNEVVGLIATLADGEESGRPLRDEKQVVADFYDQFGWQRDGEQFRDALAFEDMRPLTAGYRARCHRRVNRHLRSGEFLLDAASGAVQLDEYASFSRDYRCRICVDLSLGGLLAAKRRLGDHAVCILGDITALPLADGVVDAFVSIHTIYHIPADEQTRAVAELYRTLKSGGPGVIVYSWGPHSRLAQLYWTWARRRNADTAAQASPPLYFHPHGPDWYKREIAARYPVKLRVWRSVEKEFLTAAVRSRLGAMLLLWPLYLAEELAPAWLGRIGVCPMFVFKKTETRSSLTRCAEEHMR